MPWEVLSCVLLLCPSPPVGSPLGSLCCVLSIPACKRKEFDCPKSPSGLVIPVDGVELAGSFVSELEDKLAGSCCLPRAGDTFAERPRSVPGASSSALSLLPRGRQRRRAGSRDSPPSGAELPEASQMPRDSEDGVPTLSPQDAAIVG